MNVLTIIPARGDSKGIQNKNLVPLASIPLLAHTVIPAVTLQKSGLLGKVLVSTDSEKIAETAKKYGAETPFIRPKSLATDAASTASVVEHALTFYQKQHDEPDAILLLQPTSPLRTQEDIKQAVTKFISSSANSLISVTQTLGANTYYFDNQGFGKPLDGTHSNGARRQESRPLYLRNGAIYIVRTSFFKRTKQLISSEPSLYIMPQSRSFNLDTPDDLKIIARML